MERGIIAVRGAVSVESQGDEGRSIVENVGRLVDLMAQRNGFGPEDIISIQFTQTKDLKVMNAAAALRRGTSAYDAVPLFCAQEPEVEGMPPRTVRVLITWTGRGEGRPVYLGKAAGLRPDLAGES